MYKVEITEKSGMYFMKNKEPSLNALSKKEFKERVSKALQAKALVRVGKNGVNKGIINDVLRHIEINNFIKVKVLQTIEDYKGTLNEIATRSGLRLVKKVGRTGIYCKEVKHLNKNFKQ